MGQTKQVNKKHPEKEELHPAPAKSPSMKILSIHEYHPLPHFGGGCPNC